MLIDSDVNVNNSFFMRNSHGGILHQLGNVLVIQSCDFSQNGKDSMNHSNVNTIDTSEVEANLISNHSNILDVLVDESCHVTSIRNMNLETNKSIQVIRYISY